MLLIKCNDYRNIPESVDVNLERLIETFVQMRHIDKENNNVLDLYTNIKHNFTYELYLDILPSNLRFSISKIRMFFHPLLIHTDRFGNNRIPRNERYCVFVTCMIWKMIIILLPFVHVMMFIGKHILNLNNTLDPAFISC
jgi:hypothetical protein